jgi:hypothetical protein
MIYQSRITNMVMMWKCVEALNRKNLFFNVLVQEYKCKFVVLIIVIVIIINIVRYQA